MINVNHNSQKLKTMKLLVKISLVALVELLINLTFRILQNNYGFNIFLTIGYFLIAFIFLLYGLNWITKGINSKRKYWKIVFIILIIILSTSIFPDLLYQLLYSKYIFKPKLFSSITFTLLTIIFFTFISMIIGFFYKEKKK